MRWIFVAALMAGVAAAGERPPCRHDPRVASSCFTVHGRLTVGQGSPGVRIWPVGTKRLLGVEDEPPNVPANVSARFSRAVFDTKDAIFGDFDICPLERERPGHMRLVCVAAATHLSVRPLR